MVSEESEREDFCLHPQLCVGACSSSSLVSTAVPTVRFADNINEFWVDEEAGELDVCLTLASIPPGGLECDIVVTLTTADGKAGMCT